MAVGMTVSSYIVVLCCTHNARPVRAASLPLVGHTFATPRCEVQLNMLPCVCHTTARADNCRMFAIERVTCTAVMQVCGKPVTTNQGKCLRPDAGRLILYLKDINLPK